MAEGAKKRGIRLIIILAVLAALLIVFFAASFTTIPEGYMGLKYELGRIVSADLTAGLQFKLPFFHKHFSLFFKLSLMYLSLFFIFIR